MNHRTIKPLADVETGLIHDLSTQLSAILILLDVSIEKLATDGTVDRAQIQKAYLAAKKIEKMISQRREVLTQQGGRMRDLSDCKILVVDDEPTLREAIKSEFQVKGFQVFGAENGVEALDLLKKQKMDVVVSDVRMPGGDGIFLLRHGKEVEPELVVVLLTGFEDVTTEEAYNVGADAVFCKPFDRRVLVETVVRATQARGHRWSRKNDRIQADLETELVFPDYNVKTYGRTTSLGAGGIFVATAAKIPHVDSRVSFSIRPQNGYSPIVGQGTVRWIQTQSNHRNPVGCGIEFDQLSDSSRSMILQLVGQARSRNPAPESE